ncbi:MAG: 4Fe-4S binding protein, partial [Sphaerochaeta sp.]|nr:4Fe-4S binding protein [Sphaerochaeta sp.]
MNRKGLLPNLFYITLAYFALGIISILFANLALLCMALPFILLAKAKKKLWCQTYCPRASLLNAAG